MSQPQASFIMPNETVAALRTKPWWHRRARHVHVWQDMGRQVFAPYTRGFKFSWGSDPDPELIDDLFFGYTLVLQACACGDRRQQHLTGQVPA